MQKHTKPEEQSWIRPGTGGRILAKRDHIEVALLDNGILEGRRRSDFGLVILSSGRPRFWSLWRHEIGYVLCPIESAENYAFEGDPQIFIDAGVQDCRHQFVAEVDRLVQQASIDPKNATIPVIVADDPYDADVVLFAASVFFHFSPKEVDELRFTLRSSHIEDWHEHREEHQLDGSLDVALGISHHPFEPDQSHESWIQSVGRYNHDVLGTRCVVISNVACLGRMRTGEVSPNFILVLNSAINRIASWDCAAAIMGSWGIWFDLVSAHGELEHTYQLIHIPASRELDQNFYQEMANAFPWKHLSREVAQEIWEAAGYRKRRALNILETPAISYAHHDSSSGRKTSVTFDASKLMLNGLKIGRQ